MNVKDEQDFNINQLIKHRNDLKLKMDKTKEDMENGLVGDKEKLKILALTGSEIYKVSWTNNYRHTAMHQFGIILTLKILAFQEFQNHLKQGKTIIQLIRLCENMEMDHQKAVDENIKKRKMLLDYSNEDLKMLPQLSSDDQVRNVRKSWEIDYQVNGFYETFKINTNSDKPLNSAECSTFFSHHDNRFLKNRVQNFKRKDWRNDKNYYNYLKLYLLKAHFLPLCTDYRSCLRETWNVLDAL